MHRRTAIASAVAIFAGALALMAGLGTTSVAAGRAPKVKVRIEGARHTLLRTHVVRVPRRGSITKGGAPRGACPANTAAGVLTRATKGRWSGSFSSQYQNYLITTILGDTENTKHSYWEILVNHAPASAGVCQLHLRRGDQIVFAAVPLAGKGQELATRAGRRRHRAGRPFRVRVVAYNAKGRARALAGATVTAVLKRHRRRIGATRVKTNRRGIARLRARHAGRLKVHAAKAGDVRAAPVTVRVVPRRAH
jgi:hypothetical protein